VVTDAGIAGSAITGLPFPHPPNNVQSIAYWRGSRVPPKPAWSSLDKSQSLIAYSDWLNALARASFLNDSGHPEMFFFISEEGAVSACQFREGLDPAKKNAVILQEGQRIKPFGTIHVRIVDAVPINSSKIILDASRKCLWLTMESRLGDTRNLVNPIDSTAEGVFLGETVVVTDHDEKNR
jgi:hypothetical protein